MTWSIRVATPDDAADVARVYAPFVTDSAISFEETPPDAAEVAHRIATCLGRFPWLVCERTGAFAGYAYAGAHRKRAAYRWSVEPSVYVADAFRRTGVGRALYGALFDILVAQGFRQTFAGITLPNDASVRFHESLGFEQNALYRAVGHKHGRWHDVVWLQRALTATTDPPTDPVPFPDLAGSDVVLNACSRFARALL